MNSARSLTLDPQQLKRALQAAGIRQPKDGKALCASRAASVSRTASSADPEAVRELCKVWLRGKTTRVQKKSVPILRDLLGTEVAAQLLGDSYFRLNLGQQRNDAIDVPKAILELLEPLAATPARLFDDKEVDRRAALAALVRAFTKPQHMSSDLEQLADALRRYAQHGIWLGESLAPFVNELPPLERFAPIDLDLLCALAGFASDMKELVDVRQLLANQVPRLVALRRRFLPVFDALETASLDPGVDSASLVVIYYQLFRHSSLKAQIAGDSRFNLSRLSRSGLAPHELRYFVENLQSAARYARVLQQLPKPLTVSASHWKELEANMLSSILRGLCFAQDGAFCPTVADILAVAERFESREGKWKRDAMQLQFSVRMGDRKDARRIADHMLQELRSASPGDLSQYRWPLYVINAYHLGGDVTDADRRLAVDIVRSNPRIHLMFGHHLIGANGVDL